jgi:hypothetical protein
MTVLTMEMRGPRGVRHAVTEFVRATLPVYVDGCRAAWGVTAAELPLPVSAPDDPRTDAYLPHEPKAVDRWPLIAVTSGRRTQRHIDYAADGSPVYEAKYPIRVYSWVKDAGYQRTQDQRDDLATAIQVMFLANTNLGSGGPLTMVPSSLVVDFSSVEAVKGERFIAAAYVGFDVQVIETLTDRLALPGEQPRDTVGSVTVTGSALPPHPALQ